MGSPMGEFGLFRFTFVSGFTRGFQHVGSIVHFLRLGLILSKKDKIVGIAKV